MSKKNKTDEKNEMVVSEAWKTRTIMGGALVGACAGLVGAYLITRRAVREGREEPITPTEGLKIGIMVAGLLRTIATLGDEK